MTAATFDELLAPRTGDELPRPTAHGERRSFGRFLKALAYAPGELLSSALSRFTAPEPSTPKARFSVAPSARWGGDVVDHYLGKKATFHTLVSAEIAADGLNSGDFDADLFTWSEA